MDLFLIRAFQLILCLSILILIHELGHYLFARLFKVRVERFYLFFNPVFSLLKMKKVDGKWRFAWFKKQSPESFTNLPDKTEFGLGWIPLGGYCTIAGMIDESLNTKQMAEEPKEWEYRSKKPGQRLLIIAGGVLFNFILALMIYSSVLYVWGEKYVPLDKASLGMDYSPFVKDLTGLEDGDRLLNADGEPLYRFDENAIRLIMASRAIYVSRDSEEICLALPSDFATKLIENNQGFASFRYPTVIKEVSGGSPCEKAGLQSGDSLVAVNDTKTVTFQQFVTELSKFKEKTITLTYFRGGAVNDVQITPDVNGKLGFMACSPEEVLPTEVQKYTFLQSIPAGIKMGVDKLTGYAGDMKYVFTEAGAKSLGGFGTLGRLFPSEFDWQIFWLTTAFLSVILAFMNILPIPALDGGHILFLLYEIISRKKPSLKFMEVAQMTGMFLLIALLVYANGNDLYRWLFK
jgi:regulator of sigma E protease